MSQLRLFRILIAAQIALTLLSILASVRLEQSLPPVLQDYLRADRDGPLRRTDVAVAASALILAALLVVAWIALLRFWRIGPWLFAACCIGSVLLVLGAGPTVETAIESASNTAWAMLGGAILAMAWFSELRANFGLARPPDDNR